MNDITLIVRAFADLRILLGARTEVVLSQGQTLGDLLEILSEKHAGFREKAFDSQGRLSEGIDIIVNGRNLGNAQHLTAQLQDGDQVYLFPSLAGG